MSRIRGRLVSSLLVLLACAVLSADEPKDLSLDLRAAAEPLRARDWAGAVRSLKAFRQAHPGAEEAKEAWVLEARALLLAKQPREALESTAAFLQAHGQDEWAARMVHTAADAHAALAQPKDAAQALRARVEATTAPEARAKVGALLLALADEDFDGKEVVDDLGRPQRVRDVARALETWRRALAMGVPEAEKIRVRERIGAALEELGRPAEAVAEWSALLDDLEKEALAATPEQEERWLVGKGRTLLAAGNRDEARKALRAALDRFPRGRRAMEILLLLGEERLKAAAEGAGDAAFEEGIAWIRRAIGEHRSDPKAAEAQKRLALAYEQRGESEKAATEWAAFVERFPNDPFVPEARDHRAEALLRAGLFDEAVAEWERFLAAHPDHPLWKAVREKIANAAYQKGDALAARGDTAGAIAAYRAFAERYPADDRAPAALVAAGSLHRQRKEVEAALGLWRSVLGRYAQSPYAAQARLLLALALEEDLARLDEAVKAYEEVIAKHPGSGEAAEAQARLDRLKGKHLELRAERVIGTSESPVLRVVTRNVEALKVRVYRLSLEEYFRRKGTVQGIENLQLEIVKPDETHEWRLGADYKPFVLLEADRPVPAKGPGAYVVVAGDDDLTATVLLLVSDVEAVVKKSHGRQVFVWAFDRASGAPVEGARVLVAGGGKTKELGTTGKDGVFVASHRAEVANVLVMTERGAASAEVPGTQWAEAGFRTKAYVTASRPVYRPGQTVDWRAVYLEADGGAYRTPGVKAADVIVLDARGQTLREEKVESTPFGTFSGSFPLDATSPLGTWTVRVRVPHVGEWSGTFEVREYRKPEFTIAVTPEQPVYRTGDRVRARLSMRYTFGGAVDGATVTWEVLRLPRTFEPSPADDYSWYFKGDAPPPPPAVGGTPVARGTLTTDEKGEGVVEFATADKDEDAEYVVRAMAEDVTRRWIGDEGRIPVTRRDHLALVRADRKVYKPKQEVRAEVRTVDALERPVSRGGTLALLRLRRNPVPVPPGPAEGRRAGIREVRDEETEVASYPISTDAKGTAEVRLSLPEPGRWRLRWRSTDARGALVTAYTDVEAAGAAEDLSKDARLVVARSLYREGERAEAMVQSPVSGVPCLLTHEGEEVLAYRVLRIESPSTLVEVPVLGEHAPNVFLKVAIPGRGEDGRGRLLEAEAGFVVLRHLEVSVTASKDRVQPGEEVDVVVEAKDASGRPVQAEVGLALVDEAVYGIVPDRSPPIRPYFYDRRRPNTVVTASSLGFRTDGTTRETSKDLLADAAAREGNAQVEYARSALRLAREALRRGDAAGAVQQALRAMEADPASWDARALLAELRTNEEARKAFAELAALDRARDRVLEAEAQLGATRPGYAAPAAPAPSPSEAPSADAADKGLEEAEKEDGVPATGGGSGWRARAAGGKRADRKEAGDAFALLDEVTNGLADGAPEHRAYLLESFKDLDASLKRVEQHQLGAAFALAAGPELEVRRSFADAAAWYPHLRTGDDGRAVVKVKLPDNLTTWRAVVRGVSASALVGEGRGSVLARKDLLVRVDPPRFLVQGDQVTVPTAVHNDSGKDLDVVVAVAAEGVDLAGEDQTLRVRDAGRAVSDRDLSAREPGRVRIEATATSTAGGDRTEVLLGTLPRGIRTFDGRSGVASTERADTQETFVDLDERAVRGATRMAVVLYPGVEDALLDALLYLDLYPYGCVEQTVHRFLPAIEARAALQAIGSPAADRLARLEDAIRQSAARLRNLQNPDGSFGWFPGGAHLEMTAYALLGFAGARSAGVPDLDRAIQSAAQATQRLLASGAEDSRALAHWALARVGVVDAEAYATTFRRRSDDLSVAGLAWLALAAKALDRSYDAEELVRLLLDRRVEKDGLTSWKGKPEDCFVGSDREATALAVRALAETETATPHAERGVRWLLERRSDAGLGTTKDTAAFVGAASAVVRKGRVHGFGGTLEVVLDGKVVRTVRTGAGALDAADRRFLVAEAETLAPGRHVVAFRLRGEGSLHWAVRLESVLATDDLVADEHGVAVARRYLKPEEAPVEGQPPPVKPGYEVLRPSARPKVEAKDLGAVRSGDRVLVRLEVVAPRDLQYVLVEDPLPSGFEVLDGTAAGAFDWQERRDDRQVFFCSKVPKGTLVLQYVLQATHLGAFTALGTTASAMYAPEVHGRAAGHRISITRHDPGRPDAERPPTPDETWALAQRLLAERRWTEARPILVALVEEQPLRDEVVEEAEAWLLRIAIEGKDAKETVRAREELVRRNAGRVPGDLDTARAIAFAYQEIGEHEVAAGLFRELVARAFALRGEYAQALLARGREVDALDLVGRELRSFPVANGTAAAAFQRAQRYRELPRPKGRARPEGRPMDPETLDALWSLTAHYAETPVADPATYALVDALRRAGDLDGAVATAEAFLARFPQSPFLDDARFFLADSRFRKFDAAPSREAGKAVLDAAEPLVSREFPTPEGGKAFSEFRPRAYHLMARVHHVLGDLDEAIRLYREAREVEDAREALAFLTEERLETDETVVKLGEGPVYVPVRYRNVEEVTLRAWPVDLQVLFALRKTLVGLNQIDLAGIAPAREWKVPLPDSADHAAHEASIELPTEAGKPGAWLVVAKSGDHEAGTLVLKTDLKAVLQRVGEKVRVYVTDASGRAVRGAHVTVSDGQSIRARGLTDGRGVFEAPGVGPTPGVVVSLNDRYATAR